MSYNNIQKLSESLIESYIRYKNNKKWKSDYEFRYMCYHLAITNYITDMDNKVLDATLLYVSTLGQLKLIQSQPTAPKFKLGCKYHSKEVIQLPLNKKK